MLRYIKQAVPDEGQLPVDSTELRLLPLEYLTQLEILVPDFQETDVFLIQRAHRTGKMSFRRVGTRNEWVWIEASIADTCGNLFGRSVV